MRRGESGSHAVTFVGGERVSAFVPAPLPPKPPVVLDGSLQKALESAVLALGRLDGVAKLLPDEELFLYAYVRKEAVLSSQIEGTQSSLSDLLLFELEQAPGVPLEDVREVSNYVAALEHGLRRLQEGFPLSNRLIREIHGVLMASGRGSEKNHGEFRRSQNWIGGTRPRKRGLRAAAAHRGARLHDGARAFPPLGGAVRAAEGRARARAVRGPSTPSSTVTGAWAGCS